MDEQEVSPSATAALMKPEAVIEVMGRDGHVRVAYKVQQWPTRIGRSPSCDLVLDDSHLAAEHAELRWTADGGPALHLLPSLNGGWLGERRLQAGDRRFNGSDLIAQVSLLLVDLLLQVLDVVIIVFTRHECSC